MKATEEEITMAAVMLFMEDLKNSGDTITVPEGIAAYANLTPREKRLYMTDAQTELDSNASKTEQLSTDTKSVTMTEIQQQVKVPAMGDLVDALSGKAELSNVLGTGNTGTGELTEEDHEKLKAYTDDVTKALAEVLIVTAVAGRGMNRSPQGDLVLKVTELATHTKSLMDLVDPNYKEDTLNGQ